MLGLVPGGREVQEDVSCVEKRRARSGGGVIGDRVRGGVSDGGMGTVSSATAGRAPTKRRSTSMRSTEGSVASRRQRPDHAPDQQYSSVSAALSCPLALSYTPLRGRLRHGARGQSFRSPQ